MPIDEVTNGDPLELADDEHAVMILSNEPTELKMQTLELIYRSIAMGQLAYMDGKNAATGEIVPMLVALEPTDTNKFNIYPLAELLMGRKNIPDYLVPDGSGTYYGIDSNGNETSEGPPEGISKNQIN